MVGASVASGLGYRFFDTGAMYRAVTWLALRRNIDVLDEEALARLVECATISVREVSSAIEATGVLLDGEDATPYLRDDAVESNVSLVSRVPRVRAVLVHLQRDLGLAGRVVMAGRDIGSVVLPEADLKIYLNASRDVRAHRREQQMRAAGLAPAFNELVADLARRDGIDTNREASPLTAAAGAVIIKTDELNVEEVVRRIVALAQG